MAEKRTRSASLGLTKKRRETALAALSATGLYARAAEACGTTPDALRKWRQRNPDFAAECDAARAEFDDHVCTKAPAVVDMHLQDCLDRAMVVTHQQGRDEESGEIFWLEKREPVSVNAAIVRFALNRLDQRWTQKLVDSLTQVGETLQQMLTRLDAEAAARAEREG